MAAVNSTNSANQMPLVVENWPMSVDAARERLKRAEQRLEQYRAALRLAGTEIERRNRGIIALTAFAYQASCMGNASAMLKLMLSQALETTSAPVGAIVTIDPVSKTLTVSVQKGLTAELIDILIGRQLGHGATALMPHLVAGSGALLEQTSDDEAEQLLLAAGRLTSLVSLPLQIGRQVLGALLVGQQADKKFGSAELCFLMAMSQETAIALDSLQLRERLWDTVEIFLGNEATGSAKPPVEEPAARVVTPFELPAIPSIPEPAHDDLEQLLAAMMAAEDEVQQHNTDLQTLNALAESFNRTLNAAEILRCAVNQTQAILTTDAAWLYLINEKNHLALSAHVGLSSAYVRGMHQLALGESLEGQVAADNMAQFIEVNPADTRGHKIWVDKEGFRSLAAVPITRPQLKTGRSDSLVIGVLAVGKHSIPSGFLWSPREVRLLSSIANQLALAIDNARLYAQIQDDHVELSAGNEILREVNEMLLQRNSSLEDFIRDDIEGALTTINQTINPLLAGRITLSSEAQQQVALEVKKIINRLDEMTQRLITSS